MIFRQLHGVRHEVCQEFPTLYARGPAPSWQLPQHHVHPGGISAYPGRAAQRYAAWQGRRNIRPRRPPYSSKICPWFPNTHAGPCIWYTIHHVKKYATGDGLVGTLQGGFWGGGGNTPLPKFRIERTWALLALIVIVWLINCKHIPEQ